ncbi:MAG TPA: hypothetical protein VHW66_19180 [Stellaceae bacterium]|nr:hypothetical protein [Stellaceae bacterium]
MMATAGDEVALAKVDPHEPVFVLRPTDELALPVIRYWIALARQHGTPKAKLDRAIRAAAAMSDWQHAYPDQVKVPD